MPKTSKNDRKLMWEKRYVKPPSGGYRRSVSRIIRRPPPRPAPWPEEREVLLNVLLGRPYTRQGRGVLKPWGCQTIEEAAVLALQVGYISLPFEVDP